MSGRLSSVRTAPFSRPPVVLVLALYRTVSKVIVDFFLKIFCFAPRSNRLRRSDNTRSTEAKQLDDGIGDTLVGVFACSGVHPSARLEDAVGVLNR